ncbi:uncharacterized protein Eint_071040 [Encephalitozoon intestinalis ATCC 50506]|uniref:Ricin B lectin domain-containing protein n=1 Tax=Encephalitozoon intestinalis (strain ATCC 50506) TaxID=876142 RepID=E0S832_ENCIT|nr:uncharacterized protein Eint_071040 [Encephalitozoon intestinalis ATCC 50506]ADM11867.1 hypothetical protein Eint_071040 [Encephalitozoon intestinalis ATCC 50506]UTX45622.1 hypothetical protein GPK93_07g11870 [Encephalitozoon intestinalis]
MILILVLGMAFSYPLYLDSFTNKPIRILAAEYHLLVSELKRDFGSNPFRAVDELNLTYGHNTRSQINRNGRVFKIRVGDSWLCRKGRDLLKCEDSIDFWEISKSGDGFTVSQEGYCLSTRDENKLVLERCNGRSRSHVFLFEDMGVESCLDSVDLNAKPRTEAEMVQQLKLKKKLENLGRKNRDEVEKIKKNLEDKNDFSKYAKKNLPDLDGKDDVKDVLRKLWDFNWRRPKFGPSSFSMPWFSFPFCKKLW